MVESAGAFLFASATRARCAYRRYMEHGPKRIRAVAAWQTLLPSGYAARFSALTCVTSRDMSGRPVSRGARCMYFEHHQRDFLARIVLRTSTTLSKSNPSDW